MQPCCTVVARASLTRQSWWPSWVFTMDTQTEAPRHGKWWLDGKTGANKRYCQQCMCWIVTPGAVNSDKNMLLAKWVERDGEIFTVSPADKCVCLLSNPARVNGIKSEGMQAKQEGKALVSSQLRELHNGGCPTHSRLQGGPAKGAIQRSPCALQHPHGPGPWLGLGGTASDCLRLWAMQRST